MNYDWIISALIILFIILAAWSKIEQQSMKETLQDIKEFLQDLKGDKEELPYGG